MHDFKMFVRSFILLKVIVHNATICNADTEMQENCIQGKKKEKKKHARALKISGRSLLSLICLIFFLYFNLFFRPVYRGNSLLPS